MRCCSGCVGYPAAERQFGAAIAERDLDRYRRKGPDASSRLLLDSVTDSVRQGDSLLDIGGGVGVLSFEFLARGVTNAVLVDAAPAYLSAAQSEAARRGVGERVQFLRGDFVELAGEVAPADVVAMHRVVCCYPDWAALLTNAAQRSRRLLALSYPRDRWFVRLWLSVENLRRRLSGHPFRSFVHPAAAMERSVETAGFQRVSRRRTAVWCVDVYAREA
jgi:Methyltransferase domain